MTTETLYSFGQLAAKFGLDRRTVAKRLKGVPAAGTRTGFAVWRIEDARPALTSTAAKVGTDPGADATFAQSRAKVEAIKAATAEVRLAKLKGALIDRARAEALVFQLARRERDAWVTWPARVAALMAADLGADAGHVQIVLNRYVRENLTELADLKVVLHR